MSKAPETIYIDAVSEKRLCSIDGYEGCATAQREADSDIAYVHHSIAYGYASEVERLKVALATLHGRPFSERAYTALHSRMQNAEALAGAAQCRVSHYESTLKYIQRNASVMTAHQIETMARDALEGK